MTDHTKPNDATRQADRAAAQADHGAPQEPTEDEARAAEQNQPNPEVAAHEKEMAERGAHQQGEGRIA
jgi:hypothetical protein